VSPSSLALNPIELVVLQGTSFCNLNCQYCDLSAESRRTKSVMAPSLVDRLFSELFQSGRVAPELTVLWHSGEPLTLPPSYYEDAMARIINLNDTLSAERTSIRFSIQTNGVLIDERWCRFLARHSHELEIGISCDGPENLHDLFRVNWIGRSTHSQTLRGMDLLFQNGIKYKIIAVVTRETLRQPEHFFNFFFERRGQLSGFHFNVLADGKSPLPSLGYSPKDRALYSSFYRRLLALSRAKHDRNEPFDILNFTHAAARILAPKNTSEPSFFENATAPLKSVSVDTCGNVTTFYAGLSIDTLRDEYGDGVGLSLGNILDISFEEMIGSKKLQHMIDDFSLSRRACERSCEYFSVCPGGFDLLKKQSLGSFDSCETTECLIHVKTLVDVLLDDIDDHVRIQLPVTEST
jgi:uncharacterized protein